MNHVNNNNHSNNHNNNNNNTNDNNDNNTIIISMFLLTQLSPSPLSLSNNITRANPLTIITIITHYLHHHYHHHLHRHHHPLTPPSNTTHLHHLHHHYHNHYPQALAPKRGHDNTGVTDRVVNQVPHPHLLTTPSATHMIYMYMHD